MFYVKLNNIEVGFMTKQELLRFQSIHCSPGSILHISQSPKGPWQRFGEYIPIPPRIVPPIPQDTVTRLNDNRLTFLLYSVLFTIISASSILIYLLSFETVKLPKKDEVPMAKAEAKVDNKEIKEKEQPKPILFEDIVESTDQSVVLVRGKKGLGAGFLIGKNIVATNKHVIANENIDDLNVHFQETKTH